MNRAEHWNQVYETRTPDDVSWFQTRPKARLQVIAAWGADTASGVIDVGGGASVVVDFLLDAGHSRPAVLDISAAALEHAKRRLESRSSEAEWIVADVTVFTPTHECAVWHDRAVFSLSDGQG